MTPSSYRVFKIMQPKSKAFRVHAFLASNTVTNEYHLKLAGELFEFAVRIKSETGISVEFINLSGGNGSTLLI